MADLMVGENSFAQDWVKRYQSAKTFRMPYESDWRAVAQHGLPRQYGGWVTVGGPANYAGTGAARTARLTSFDSTLTRALPIYAAVLERVLTPSVQQYHGLQATDKQKRKSRTITLGLESLNETLFQKRYEPRARFVPAQSETYISGGAYGNAGKMITWREPDKQMRRAGGLLYRNIPFRNLFWDIDDDEQIYTKYRRIDWTTQQAILALGDKCPKRVKENAGNSSDPNRTWEFFQVITRAADYDEHALDYRKHPIGSYYIFVDEPTLVKEASGYTSDPLLISRAATEGGNPYGYGPSQVVLSTVGLVNAQKKTWLKQGQLAVQPALLTRDDGVMNGQVDMTPGAQNPGGVDSQGRRLVQMIEQGNFQLMEKMIAAEQDDIKEALFGRVFEIIRDQPQKTATEVLDIAAREAAQLAPTMGRYQAEDLGPQIEREIVLLAEHNALPPDLPIELSDLDYTPIYTSPLAKSQHSESVSGFMRLAEMTMNFAKNTGDNRAVRRLNLDVALPEIAAQQSVPARWIKSDDEMAASDAEAADQRKTDTAVAIAAPAASILKAGMDKNAGMQ